MFSEQGISGWLKHWTESEIPPIENTESEKLVIFHVSFWQILMTYLKRSTGKTGTEHLWEKLLYIEPSYTPEIEITFCIPLLLDDPGQGGCRWMGLLDQSAWVIHSYLIPVCLTANQILSQLAHPINTNLFERKNLHFYNTFNGQTAMLPSYSCQWMDQIAELFAERSHNQHWDYDQFWLCWLRYWHLAEHWTFLQTVPGIS